MHRLADSSARFGTVTLIHLDRFTFYEQIEKSCYSRKQNIVRNLDAHAYVDLLCKCVIVWKLRNSSFCQVESNIKFLLGSVDTSDKRSQVFVRLTITKVTLRFDVELRQLFSYFWLPDIYSLLKITCQKEIKNVEEIENFSLLTAFLRFLNIVLFSTFREKINFFAIRLHILCG